MKILKYIILIWLGITTFPAMAQISFFTGNFNEALQKAKDEKKAIFADFYTQWCGPCKLMTKEIFTQPETGEYFNSRFVAIQIDAESPEGKTIAQKYSVDAYPWMVFMDAEGKQLRVVKGAVPAQKLLKEAKIALGEALSFEQLYEKYKKDKKNYPNTQQLLLEANEFMATTKGFDRQKWTVRIESIFKEYVKNKGLKNMINPEDFYILTFYHVKIEKDDPIFDFIVEHYIDYAQVLDKKKISQFLIGLYNGQIIKLCKAGNTDYKKYLERLDGNLKEIYAGIKFGDLSVKEAVTLLADATYYLYRKDEEHFFENIDRYFAGAGNNLTVNDYTQPIEDLYTLYQGKISEKAQHKCIIWIGKALEKEMGPNLRIRLLIMLGECYQGTGDRVKAKQSYNQAFLLTPQIEDEGYRNYLKEMAQEKLQGV